MEEIKNGEQPEKITENVQSGIVENEERGTACLEESSGSLGKFKDAESMLKAYNNLQAEFTRKCQKLSELSKMFEQNSSIKMENENDKNNQGKELNNNNLNATEEIDENEIQSTQNHVLEGMQQSDKTDINKAEQTPIYLQEDWQKNVSAFLNQNSEAREYSGEIANEILNNKHLQTSPYALELAWANIMKKEFKSPKVLAHDQNFINEQILSRDEIKRQVLEEYFKNIQSSKTPPLISNSGNVAGITYKEPTTMQEAKQAVARLFNLKGN